MTLRPSGGQARPNHSSMSSDQRPRLFGCLSGPRPTAFQGGMGLSHLDRMTKTCRKGRIFLECVPKHPHPSTKLIFHVSCCRPSLSLITYLSFASLDFLSLHIFGFSFSRRLSPLKSLLSFQEVCFQRQLLSFTLTSRLIFFGLDMELSFLFVRRLFTEQPKDQRMKSPCETSGQHGRVFDDVCEFYPEPIGVPISSIF